MKSSTKWLLGVGGVIVVVGIVVGIVVPLQLNKKDFSKEFQFGAATSSYQIEGGANADGKSDSIWDTATRNFPNFIKDRSNGNEAASSYQFYKEDVKAIKDTGLHFYRFSISWPRILPEGSYVNQAGINYYNKLIDELIANGIEPMVTAYHWDLPQYLQDIGGWTNPLISNYYEHYVDVLFKAFGDRVKKWITFNEPYIFCSYGYGEGTHAPLISQPGLGEYQCGHNVLNSHAKAYHLYKTKYSEQQKGQVGICFYSAFFYPLNDNVNYTLVENAQEHMLGWFANPIFSTNGDYPQVMKDNIKRNSDKVNRPWSRLPEFTDKEKEDLKGSADFLALNYYTSRYVQPKETYPTEYDWESDAGIDLSVDRSWPKGKSGFLYSVPEGLHDLLVWIKNKYNNPTVLITENGWSDDGEIEDDGRITYIRDHLKAISKAIKDGCNVVAYTVWSIIDNFEWAAGYTEKFGIYKIDFASPNKERIPKKSSKYLSEVVSSRKI